MAKPPWKYFLFLFAQRSLLSINICSFVLFFNPKQPTLVIYKRPKSTSNASVLTCPLPYISYTATVRKKKKMSYFSDLNSSSVCEKPRSPPPLVPINPSDTNGRASVIRLRGKNKSERFRPYTRFSGQKPKLRCSTWNNVSKIPTTSPAG